MVANHFRANPMLVAIAIGTSLAMSATGCSKKVPEPAATEAPKRAEKPAEPIDSHTIHGVNKKLAHPVAVFVDGEQVSVLRPGELPPGLAKVDNAFEGFADKRYYRLADYLAKIGVPVDQIKTIHLTGHRDHIASIEGTELRAQPERFVFDFGQATTILPKSHWSTVGLKNGLRIDGIRNVAVFVKKSAPELDARMHCYKTLKDGVPECGPAYDVAAVTATKGTRIYVDGKFAGYFKRRKVVASAGQALDSDKLEAFSLEKYLATFGVDSKSAKGVEFIVGDDVVARAGNIDFSFKIPRHSHGRIAVHMPANTMAAGTSGDRDVPVTAIQVYRSAAPGDRPLAPLSDDAIASASKLGAEQTELGAEARGADEEI